jgi:uncharacterized protein (TIGR00290 family)
MEKVLLSWSGGKDSAMTLYELRRAGGYDIVALLTTITEGYDRISMHGVRRVLLEQQAASLGLALHEAMISPGCTNAHYEATMRAVLTHYQAQGVTACAFGDLFLQDIRTYRERNLAAVGMKALFPVWGRDTTEFIRSFIALGFKAVVTCVDPRALPPTFAGRVIDERFLRDLPPGVDPCGENGEFHSFVYAGPLFREEVKVTVGQVVLRDGFTFCDLLPEEETP